MPERSNDTRQIFLGNISYDASPEDVVLALQEIGVAVARVRLATWPDTGAPRGFGFCDLEPRERRSVEEVIEHVNEVGATLFGRDIRAAKANERPKKPAQSGRARDEAPWRNEGKKKKSPRRAGGGRGRGPSEFKRGRHEFEGD